MWRNLVSSRNLLSVNQTVQYLKRSTVLSFSFSPVSLNQMARYSLANPQFRKEIDTLMSFRKVMVKQTDVSLSFAKHLFLKEANKNVVMSPLSIQVVLSLVAAGSKGATLRQLLSFLKANSVNYLNSFATRLSNDVFTDRSPCGGVCLSFANGLWFDQSVILKPSFKQIVDSHYKATLAQVDFQNKAAQVNQQINSWVEKNTNGLIRDLVHEGSLGSQDRLVLLNALCFKGVWFQKFYSSETEDDEFHLLCGSSVKAPFRTSRKKHLINICDGFKVLGLPYMHRFTMYIILPDSNDGLPSLVEKELGLTLPFAEGEFTEMADSIDAELLYVSDIFQKAFIDVDEGGTKAAVITGIMSCRQRTIDFVADHSFMFLIRENITGAVLVVGQVINPLEDSNLDNFVRD